MVTYSGQLLNSELIVLVTLQPLSTPNRFYTLHYNTSGISLESTSPKAPMQGKALRHAQRHHTVSSGPTVRGLVPV